MVNTSVKVVTTITDVITTRVRTFNAMFIFVEVDKIIRIILPSVGPMSPYIHDL